MARPIAKYVIPTQPLQALISTRSILGTPSPRMVGLPSAYLCASAKRASIIYATLRCASTTTPRRSSRQSDETGFTDFRHDEIEHGGEESASMANPTAVQTTQAINTTKIKKKFSELPKFRVLPDGSVAKPLEQWQSGDDTPPKDSNFAYADAKDLLCQIEAEQSFVGVAKDNADAVNPDNEVKVSKRKPRKKIADNDEVALKKGILTNNVEISEKEEPVENKKRTRKKQKDSDDESIVREKSKRAVKAKKVNEGSDGLPKSVLAQEIRDNLSNFPHCLLLTRVGNFYESYFEQAVEISRILNIKLASRRWGGGRVPMCGFPLLHIDKHLKVMVQQHKRFVAMCEEFPKYTSLGDREFERRVVRVITPGTLIDESFLNQYENNYLLAVSVPSTGRDSIGDPTLGLAWIDVSTGEFYSKRSSYEDLRDEIVRIGPQEIVLDRSLETQISHPVMETVAEESNVVSFVVPLHSNDRTNNSSVQSSSSIPAPDEAVSVSNAHIPLPSEANVTDEIIIAQDVSPSSPFMYTSEETSAINLLTTYLRANLLEHMPSLSLPNREDAGGRMQIDSHTIKALEIRESMREGGVRGSLMSSVKRTITTSGTRLLARWLCSPSTSIQEINARQSLVAFFYSRPHFRADLLTLLAKAEDAGRIVQKFLLGKGDPSDMLALTATVNIWSEIQRRVAHEREMQFLEQQSFDTSEWTSLDTLMNRMVHLEDLAQRISLAVENPANSQFDDSQDHSSEDNEDSGDGSEANLLRAEWRYGRTKSGIKIKPEFSATLLELNNMLKDLWQQKAKMEEKLQLKYDAPSLTLRSSPGQGMHVHLAKSKRDQRKLNADSDFVSINETGTTRSFFFQDWAHLGQKIFTTSIAVAIAEKEAFETLRQEVNLQAPNLRRNARVLDELDVTLAFAQLATDMNLVRPSIKDDMTYNVVNGRHPTVELGLLTSGRVFTPNTVTLTPPSHFHVITGPNMAGKSTVLRQTALIAILAQSGSFVPADAATLGIVDKLFSRVGAKDDLFHDRSTFMVEMLETAEILRRATPRSLVIMDEVGRGTTVRDGIAIAFATIHHLISVNRCRTLFATHFHELSEMLGYQEDMPFGQGVFENAAFYCTTLDELENGSFSYSYRLRPGVNRDSHGLKVAQLAGMPQQAISVAQNVLAALKGSKAEAYNADDLAAIGRRLSPG
ncbi:muts domain V-domain-containing protein [Lentinula boryana]|uniref:Muts domain V-domain-containing protein n=1 Tax=Lentinula boryana TaxID=40481 RepID=A0ABQ8QSJ6_9AGAR|nr:muts domain V-domain-containing protein [Lentinula boryana]